MVVIKIECGPHLTHLLSMYFFFITVLSWLGRRNLAFSNMGTSRKVWNRRWGSFTVDTWILSNNMNEYYMKFCRSDLIITYTNTILQRSDFIPKCDLITRSDLQNFITFATGVACWPGTLTPPDTLSRPIWDVHKIMFYLRSILFLNLPLFRTMHFEHPSVLSRCCISFDVDHSI